MLETFNSGNEQESPTNDIDVVEKFPTTMIPIFTIDASFTSEEITDFVDRNKEYIQHMPGIFLTKANRNLLGSAQLRTLTKRIKKYNPTIRIMIDQEGGKVKRYKDFDQRGFEQYNLKLPGCTSRWKALSPKLQTQVSVLLQGDVFPSFHALGEVYRSLSSGTEKNAFLNYITYMRLITLKSVGMTTYGFVCDLSRGNPAITGLDRSFSTSIDEYAQFGKYMVANAGELDMGLYLKHFPGHGKGADSHHNILKYSQDTSTVHYLQDNIQLFSQMLEYKDTYHVEVGLMVGHMIIPHGSRVGDDNLLDGFLDGIARADYIVTDDLAMQGHVQATGFYDKDAFYTTDIILDQSDDVMQLDFKSSQYITH